jgi:hypothetical protein
LPFAFSENGELLLKPSTAPDVLETLSACLDARQKKAMEYLERARIFSNADSEKIALAINLEKNKIVRSLESDLGRIKERNEILKTLIETRRVTVRFPFEVDSLATKVLEGKLTVSKREKLCMQLFDITYKSWVEHAGNSEPIERIFLELARSFNLEDLMLLPGNRDAQVRILRSLYSKKGVELPDAECFRIFLSSFKH